MVITHRERKKEQTRQALIASAHRLFAQNGYNATTLADITAGANCAPRTFFQYFTSKEDLLLVGIDEFWDDFAANVAARPKDITALEATRGWITIMTKNFINNNQPFMEVLEKEVANTHIPIQARAKLYSITRMREILIPELAKDLGTAPDATEPRLIATATAAMFDAYHSDPVLAKNGPLGFLDIAFKTLEAMANAISKNKQERKRHEENI